MPAAADIAVTLVVARASNGVIGRDNAMPWHLPEDLRHFKATTMGHAIVMGRKTFESIGRALPGRRTIVVTRDAQWQHAGCERAGSVAQAIALAARPDADASIAADEVFIVGGGQIYRDALPLADRAIVTEIDVEVDGDTRFPTLTPPDWVLRDSQAHRSASGLAYRIERWERTRPA
ncbi:MAG: dihydrofolate reductase [Burkholderiales bacterium]|nr:dihydrofolate reductase [Burkholderiales bacterium]